MLVLRLGDELEKRVAVLATRQGRKINALVREALIRYMEDQGKTVLLRVKDDELSKEDIADVASARSAVAEGQAIPWNEVKKALEF